MIPFLSIAKNKTWLNKTLLDVDYSWCCICSFEQNIYIFDCSPIVRHNKCFTYNIKDDEWNKIAKLDKYRYGPACTVFESKIVVSGGYYNYTIKSVESYDYYEKNGLIYLIWLKKEDIMI